MNVVVVSTAFPLPAQDGASLRVLYVVRALARVHRVTFCSLARQALEQRHVDELRSICQAVHVVEHRRPPWKRLWQMAAAAFYRDPYLAVIYRSEALCRLLADLASRAEVVQAEFPYGGQYFDGLSCRTVVDAHNVEADILRLQYPRERNWLRRASSYLQWRKMARFEAEIWRSASAVLATSEADRATIRRFNPSTFLVPNGIVVPQATSRQHDSGTVTFTGLMSYPANEDAALHLVEAIWPAVRGPGRRLMIVGRDPGAAIRRLDGGDITVTGTVPEIAPYLSRSSVFVAPLRIGSGTRIKILEAMAHGVPVVATSTGCMGLEVVDGEHLLIADTPRDFANCVNRLLEDAPLQHKIADSARALVTRIYSWDAIGETLCEVYRQWA